MTTQILSSLKLAEKIQKKLKNHLVQFQIKPRLLVILIGQNPASEIYVNHKKNTCAKVGIDCVVETYKESITEDNLIQILHKHNENHSIHGILVQLPLPAHINFFKIIEHMNPHKDVDGFHPYNLGRLAAGNPYLRPCTPYGIMQLLEHYKVPLKGIDALIIGKSTIVGRPMALELLMAQATVTLAHRQTKNLQEKIDNHSLIIVATGQRGIIDSNQFKPYHTIIDVGIHRLENGKISGDIDFNIASQLVSAITPVPGGVGPMTICTLLQNIVQAFENQYHHNI